MTFVEIVQAADLRDCNDFNDRLNGSGIRRVPFAVRSTPCRMDFAGGLEQDGVNGEEVDCATRDLPENVRHVVPSLAVY